MLQWQIGEVTVTRVVEFESNAPASEDSPYFAGATPGNLRTMPWLYPHFATDDGALKLSVHALVVEAPGLKLVVDTCVGNDKPRKLTRHKPLRRPFLKSLEDAGFPRESVSTVVCTHLHVDHVGWNTMLEDTSCGMATRSGSPSDPTPSPAKLARASPLRRAPP